MTIPSQAVAANGSLRKEFLLGSAVPQKVHFSIMAGDAPNTPKVQTIGLLKTCLSPKKAFLETLILARL